LHKEHEQLLVAVLIGTSESLSSTSASASVCWLVWR